MSASVSWGHFSLRICTHTDCSWTAFLRCEQGLFNKHMLFQITSCCERGGTHGASVAFLSLLLYFGLGCKRHFATFGETAVVNKIFLYFCHFLLYMWLMRIKIFTCASRCAYPHMRIIRMNRMDPQPHGQAYNQYRLRVSSNFSSTNILFLFL